MDRCRCDVDVRSMRGRCEVDARSMRGRCEVDARSMRGRCEVDARSMDDRCGSAIWAGRARVPCSFVAQPPACAPLWLVDRSVGCPSPRGCRARPLSPLVALLLRAVAPCASQPPCLAVVEVVGVGFFGRLRTAAARCPASVLPLWSSLSGLPPFSFVLLRFIRCPRRRLA